MAKAELVTRKERSGRRDQSEHEAKFHCILSEKVEGSFDRGKNLTRALSGSLWKQLFVKIGCR